MAEPSMSEVVKAMELWVDAFAFASSAPRSQAERRGWAWLSAYADERASEAPEYPEDPQRPADGESEANP